MSYEIRDRGPLAREMSISIPSDEIQLKLETTTSEVAKSAKINGFRKGKVPEKLIRTRYGTQLKWGAVSDIAEAEIKQAFQREAIDVAWYKRVELGSEYEVGQPLEFSVLFEVKPEISFEGLAQLEVEVPEFSPSEEDLDNWLQKYLANFIDWLKVDRPVQSGDRVHFRFVYGKSQAAAGESSDESAGAPTATASSDETNDPPYELQLVVGEIEEEALKFLNDTAVGTTTGDSFDAERPDSAGELWQPFECQVLAVEAGQRPELDDEFFAQEEVPADSAEELRSKAAEQLEAQFVPQVQSLGWEKVKAVLLDLASPQVPSQALATRIEASEAQYNEIWQRIAKSNTQPGAASPTAQGAEDQASTRSLPSEDVERIKRELAWELVEGAFVKHFALQPDYQQVEVAIREYAQRLQFEGYPEEQIAERAYNERTIQQLTREHMSRQIRDKTIEVANRQTLALGSCGALENELLKIRESTPELSVAEWLEPISDSNNESKKDRVKEGFLKRLFKRNRSS